MSVLFSNLSFNRRPFSSDGYSTNYLEGSAFGTIATGIVDNIFNKAFGPSWGCGYSSYSSYSGNTGSNKTNTVTSSYDSQIKTIQAAIKNAEKIVDTENPDLQSKINNATAKLTNYKTLKGNYTTAKSNLEKATEPQKPAETDQAAQAKYEKDLAAYNALKNTVETAKKALADAGYTDADKDYTEEIQEEINGAKEAKKEAIAEYKSKQQKLLDELKQKAQAELGLSSALDKKDSSWIKRQFDGKDSIQDKMAAFRKASDKFLQNPYSLTDTEIETLQNAGELKKQIANNDNTESVQSVLAGLDTWADGSKDAQLERAKRANKGEISFADFKELQKYGYFKKSDRKVTQNGKATLQTIYKGGNHEYIVTENGTLQKLTKSQNGNILHKAEYKVD